MPIYMFLISLGVATKGFLFESTMPDAKFISSFLSTLFYA